MRIPPADVALFIIGAILFGGALVAIIITQGPGAFSGTADEPQAPLRVEKLSYTIFNDTVNVTGTVANHDDHALAEVVVTMTAYDAAHHILDQETLPFNGTLAPGEHWNFAAILPCSVPDVNKIASYAATAAGNPVSRPADPQPAE